MHSFGERVLTTEVAGVDLQDLLVRLRRIGGERVEGSSGVVDGAEVGEQQPQQRLGLQHRGLGLGGHPVGECGATLVGDRVDGAASLADELLARGGHAVFDELLGF